MTQTDFIKNYETQPGKLLAAEPIRDIEVERNVELARLAMDSLAVTHQTDFGIETYYEAADPGYKSSFTRDSLVAGGLAGNPQMLGTAIDYSVNRIGRSYNAYTGEEPGKPHHELPSVEFYGKSTAYNACDTAAELLRSLAVLSETTQPEIIAAYPAAIDETVNYIKRHVDLRGLFVEDPIFASAIDVKTPIHEYALNVTYWKDSELNRLGKKKPHYPIVYSLAHFQNAHALERIGTATEDERLVRYGRYMTESGLRHLWRDDHFVTAIDEDGEIDAPSSDSLHCLLYISRDQLPKGYADKIELYMQQLETQAGYRGGIPVVGDVDPYHMGVWSHEQALLNAAATKHGLSHAQDTTQRIVDYIDPAASHYPEVLNPDNFKSEGNNRQLWSMAAYIYFASPFTALL